MTAHLLRLEDGVDSIDFINDSGSTFYLVDGTLEMPAPTEEETEVAGLFSQGTRLSKVNLKDREVSFNVKITGATQAAIVASLNRLYRLVGRSKNQRALSGGSFNNSSGYNSNVSTLRGTVTGDQGLRLTVRYGEVGTEGYLNEVGEAMTDDRTFVFKVISGNVVAENVFSVEGSSYSGNGKSSMSVISVELKCQPLALGSPMRVSTVSSLRSLVYPDTGASAGWTNRIVIPANQVPGTHDALVRFSTAMATSMEGLLLARDAGPSLLNCPSAPTGITWGAVIPVGIIESSVPAVYDVNVVSINGTTGNPTVRWRKNNGTYSGNTLISSAYTPIMIDGSDVGFYTTDADWRNFVGVTAGSTARFRNNQSSFLNNTTYNVYTNRVAYMSDSGYGIGGEAVLAQPGLTGKYRVMLSLSSLIQPHEYEVKAKIQEAGGQVISQTAWVPRPKGMSTWIADLGVLDLSPNGSAAGLHPGAAVRYYIEFSVRGIDSPPSGATMSKERMLLVPCSDDYSTLRVGWLNANKSAQVFSNFEANAPYFAQLTRDVRTGATYPLVNLEPMAETHEGQMITLVPGVTNTLLVHGLFSSSTNIDYRNKSAEAGSLSTGRVDVAIRPRYMFVG